MEANLTNVSQVIEALRKENATLQAEKDLLWKMIAWLMGDRTIVYREDEIEKRPVPRFVIDENIGGDIIIKVKK